MFDLGYCRFYVELLKCEVIITLVVLFRRFTIFILENYCKSKGGGLLLCVRGISQG